MSFVDNSPGISMTGLQGPLENSFKYCLRSILFGSLPSIQPFFLIPMKSV